jgi:hypothetical protein
MVSWLTVLDSVPDIDLLVYLPNFLNGLFKILGDPEAVRLLSLLSFHYLRLHESFANQNFRIFGECAKLFWPNS